MHNIIPDTATLSAMSMVPVVGDAIGKGGKVFRAAIKHGDEIVDGTKDSARIIKNARQRAVHGNRKKRWLKLQDKVLEDGQNLN